MDKFLTLITLGILKFVFVKEGTSQIVMRFGRYAKTLKSGLRGFFSLGGLFGSIYKFSIIDSETHQKIKTSEVDTKEMVYDYPKERVISSDSVKISALEKQPHYYCLILLNSLWQLFLSFQK